MNDPDLIGLFVEPLDAIGVSCMITGGVASVIYGDPRFTRAVDLVMELGPSDIYTLVSKFDPAVFYVPPTEALEEEAGRTDGGHFNIIHHDPALRADVYLAGDDPFIAWAFERRVRLQVDGSEIWVAPIEYVILRKLEYYEESGSDRHLRDVAMMLRFSGGAVDSTSLAEWSTRLGLEATLGLARRFSPE